MATYPKVDGPLPWRILESSFRFHGIATSVRTLLVIPGRGKMEAVNVLSRVPETKTDAKTLWEDGIELYTEMELCAT